MNKTTKNVCIWKSVGNWPKWPPTKFAELLLRLNSTQAEISHPFTTDDWFKFRVRGSIQLVLFPLL